MQCPPKLRNYSTVRKKCMYRVEKLLHIASILVIFKYRLIYCFYLMMNFSIISIKVPIKAIEFRMIGSHSNVWKNVKDVLTLYVASPSKIIWSLLLISYVT